ncbi:MAG: hypothetical protein ACM3JJ_04575 [Hyphomicrobiales bacterium]
MEPGIVAFLFVIPVIAIIGGIAMGIVRLHGQQRLEELARKERIAAIERGLDPEKLESLGQPVGYGDYGIGNGRLRRAHGLLIAGLVLIASGIGIGVLIQAQEPDKSHWTVGVLPALVGVALLLASRVVWPKPKA